MSAAESQNRYVAFLGYVGGLGAAGTGESEKDKHRTIQAHDVLIIEPADVITDTVLPNSRQLVHHQGAGKIGRAHV